MIITLPHPPKILSPNGGRGNIMAHAAAVKKWKNAVKTACALAGVPKPDLEDSLNYGITWCHSTNIRPDADNIVAMLKSTIDGIFGYFGVDDSVADINRVIRVKTQSYNCVCISFGPPCGTYDLGPFMTNPVVRKKRTSDKISKFGKTE